MQVYMVVHLCVSTVTERQPAQGVHSLLPEVSWDWIQFVWNPWQISGIDHGLAISDSFMARNKVM